MYTYLNKSILLYFKFVCLECRKNDLQIVHDYTKTIGNLHLYNKHTYWYVMKLVCEQIHYLHIKW